MAECLCRRLNSFVGKRRMHLADLSRALHENRLNNNNKKNWHKFISSLSLCHINRTYRLSFASSLLFVVPLHGVSSILSFIGITFAFVCALKSEVTNGLFLSQRLLWVSPCISGHCIQLSMTLKNTSENVLVQLWEWCHLLCAPTRLLVYCLRRCISDNISLVVHHFGFLGKNHWNVDRYPAETSSTDRDRQTDKASSSAWQTKENWLHID